MVTDTLMDEAYEEDIPVEAVPDDELPYSMLNPKPADPAPAVRSSRANTGPRTNAKLKAAAIKRAGGTPDDTPIRPRTLNNSATKVREYEEMISNLETEVQQLEDELEKSVSDNEALQKKYNDSLQNGQNDVNNENYVHQLLSASGVPSQDYNGHTLTLADRVVYLISQNSLAASTLSMLRNELMAVGHQMNKSKNVRVAADIFNLLSKSSQMGNVVIVSEND